MMTTNGIMEGPFRGLARSAWQAVLLTGVLAVVLGAIILIWPNVSLLVAGVLFGLYLLISGIFALFSAFGPHISPGWRALSFVSGALSVVLGIFCFRRALESVALLAIWIGIVWVMRGLLTTMAAISDRALPERGWQGFLGVITLIAGFVLIAWPLSSIRVLAVLVGVWLIVLGVMEIFGAFRVRRGAARLSAGIRETFAPEAGYGTQGDVAAETEADRRRWYSQGVGEQSKNVGGQSRNVSE
jgi:uncharacterized membrane protein HdeD (DUF308 family)